MPLIRQPQPSSKAEREPHVCVPVHGEFGRYMVNSRSAAKQGNEEAYIVDVLAKEETNVGEIIGTCGCKGWQIRKDCSHLRDARVVHEEHVAKAAADALGFKNLDEGQTSSD